MLTGVLADQAALYGVLAEFEALGLELIEVRRLPSHQPNERFGDQDRDRREIRIAAAVLRLAQGGPEAAAVALAPVLDGSAPVVPRSMHNQAFLLEAIALERALDIAEPDGAPVTFLLHPAPGLLERHARQRTARPSLIAEILGLLAGKTPAPPPAAAQPPREPLSETEIRVLRYPPTNLPAPEIASEPHASPNTVKTHVRHLDAKLGTHRRREAVARARGLLAPPDGADPSPARHSPTSCAPTAAISRTLGNPAAFPDKPDLRRWTPPLDSARHHRWTCLRDVRLLHKFGDLTRRHGPFGIKHLDLPNGPWFLATDQGKPAPSRTTESVKERHYKRGYIARCSPMVRSSQLDAASKTIGAGPGDLREIGPCLGR
jgi:DNA-binding CsgD family transcriptional regulator